ncbi:uncharacterized protein (DUF1330 family) [Sphingorhabdus rigui]|jgi:uncharacterized protein (DUF1330 family)|uniref:Uncharacterized protein (DUF1330 family) n=1 Tax=Sphingorhabdus rigui TaxID=1282858 RepID=A0A840AXX1_9SPHN|nr:DUF1330 domain-containing protein [Sphingorhabdus rigui]MBB3942491.1 uncharacterized protein (DUF1330 family) [Sphingorhabdus rigui]
MRVENAVFPGTEQITSFFGGPENGPFVMVNLLKFKETAEYADGSDADLSGARAYARYGKAIQACLAAVDGRQIYAGPVTGLMIGEVEELWDMVALVEYPSLAAMQKMMSSPEYRAIEVHRKAGLAGQLNIRTSQIGR